MKILWKIHTYVEKYWVQRLLGNLWVGVKTYYDFINTESQRKFSKNILNKFYSFFNEKPWEYYARRVSQSTRSANLVWEFLKLKREEQNLTIVQVAKNLKCSERQVWNIEKNGVKNQYLDIICGMKDLYAMTYDEKFELDTLIAMSAKIQNRIKILNEKIQNRKR